MARPVHVEGHRAQEAVEGVADGESVVVEIVLTDFEEIVFFGGAPQRIGFKDEVVVADNIPIEIATDDGDHIADAGEADDADVGQMVSEIATLDGAPHEVVVGWVGAFANHSTGIELRDDGEGAMIGGEIALEIEQDMTEGGFFECFGERHTPHGVRAPCQIEIAHRALCREIFVVFGIEKESCEKAHGVVVRTGLFGKRIVGIVHNSATERGVFVVHTHRAGEVAQMEFGEVELGIDLVGDRREPQFVVIVNIEGVLSNIHCQMGAAQATRIQREIGRETRVVAQTESEEGFEAPHSVLVEADTDAQSGAFLGIVAEAEREVVRFGKHEIEIDMIPIVFFPHAKGFDGVALVAFDLKGIGDVGIIAGAEENAHRLFDILAGDGEARFKIAFVQEPILFIIGDAGHSNRGQADCVGIEIDGGLGLETVTDRAIGV